MASGNMQRPNRLGTCGIMPKIPLVLLTLTTALAGCQHQDAVDSVTSMWHNYEGGEIAKLRPPPPGQNLPYPHAGRTPTRTPELPSPEARMALTERLEAQRNLAQRESAANGALLDTSVHSKTGTTSKPTPTFASADQSGMTMTAVGQPDPQPAPSATTDAPPISPKSSVKATPPAQTPSVEAALPQVVTRSIPPTPPGEFPKIGDVPPPAPQFPGFNIPRDAGLPDPVQPDIDSATPDGTLIRFAPTTDHALGNPASNYQHIAQSRGHRRIVVLGFGSAMSAEAALSPTDQSREIALGLLRAKAIAQGLMDHGVPASDIILRAEAIGDGARVTYAP